MSGCSALTPHKIDVQQGNVITPEMMAQLRTGMTRSQVRFLLGTPPMADAFHADRWDYVYRSNKRGKLLEEHTLSLFFQNDQLVRMSGDLTQGVPAAAEDKPSTKLREIVLEKAAPEAPAAPR